MWLPCTISIPRFGRLFVTKLLNFSTLDVRVLIPIYTYLYRAKSTFSGTLDRDIQHKDADKISFENCKKSLDTAVFMEYTLYTS